MEDRVETPKVDVEQVMEQIRENIRKRRQTFPLSKATNPLPTDQVATDLSSLYRSSDIYPSSKVANPLPTDQVATDLSSLHRSSDIYPFRFTSHRRVLGHFVVLAKKILQQLLTPILEQQVAYNTANTRLTSSLWEQVATLCQQQDTALQALQEQLWEGAQQHTGALQTLRAEVVALGQSQGAAVQRLQAKVVAGQQQLAALQAEVAALGQSQSDALQALQTELVAVEQRQSDALQALRAEVVAGQQQQAALQAEVAALGQSQSAALQALRTEVEQGATHRETRMVEGERTIAQLRTESILQDRRITLLMEEARKRLPDAWDQEQLQIVADEANHVLDALYVSFEDQFRGTRADIKERLSVYLPILQQAPLGSETAPILDVGCGRGEWLEVLQEAGLRGQGVDRNRVLVEQCQRRGLEVVEGDGLAYLRSVPDASLGAVTGFHIIEHLPLEVLIKVLDETVRVLIPGGVAIFETPNPQNVLVGSHNFYLDPTHRNPLPSSVMQFIAEARGLCRVKIIELHPYPEASHVQETHLEVAQRFNEYFYGPQDYGVVGWKA